VIEVFLLINGGAPRWLDGRQLKKISSFDPRHVMKELFMFGRLQMQFLLQGRRSPAILYALSYLQTSVLHLSWRIKQA
jgi:hypothetical protein